MNDQAQAKRQAACEEKNFLFIRQTTTTVQDIPFRHVSSKWESEKVYLPSITGCFVQARLLVGTVELQRSMAAE